MRSPACHLIAEACTYCFLDNAEFFKLRAQGRVIRVPGKAAVDCQRVTWLDSASIIPDEEFRHGK